MDEATNVWEEVPDWGGVGARRLIRQPGGGLGASIWDIHPGGENWHHFHHGSDELLVVLRGTPTVKTPRETRVLAAGDVLPLPKGPAGARTITNESDAVARVLIVSTNADPDVAEYPDSGKVGIWIHEQGRFFRNGDAVEHAGPDD